MEFYLDANATTPVLARAGAAALAAMVEACGNPSSTHGAGLRARAARESVRACARRVLGASQGAMVFTSGATEGIQTAVLSVLDAARREGAGRVRVLHGATEHKAVPEAVAHWAKVLGLELDLRAIPVGIDGRHDLGWLARHAADAHLVCTMAANNETGVVSDLDGIAAALAGSPARWLVDGVQALGKLPMRLDEPRHGRRIDYAVFSGHKVHAPKGIGLLHVHEDAPFVPLMMGGGQEEARRSGTENMPGIAALGVVLSALESGDVFRDADALHRGRARLCEALRDAFPGVVFNAPEAIALPTTINFAVPGIASKAMTDLLDAAGLRMSGGSACSASRAEPSHVLVAMGVPAWQAAGAVRLSFGLDADDAFIDGACARLRDCGRALAGARGGPGPDRLPVPDGLTRFAVAGACCYVLADAASAEAVVVDPLEALVAPLVDWVNARGLCVRAVLDTHGHADHASPRAALCAALGHAGAIDGPVDALGWPLGRDAIALGARTLRRLDLPGHTEDSRAFLVEADGRAVAAFVGDTVLPGALGRSDLAASAPGRYAASLRRLAEAAGPDLPLLPGHDYQDRLLTTLAVERAAQPLLAAALSGLVDDDAFARTQALQEQALPETAWGTVLCGAQADRPACAEEAVPLVDLAGLRRLAAGPRPVRLVDVREPQEQLVGGRPDTGLPLAWLELPVARVPDAMLRGGLLDGDEVLVLCCRSGDRSARVARALRRLGRSGVHSLSGGFALAEAGGAEAPLHEASAA